MFSISCSDIGCSNEKKPNFQKPKLRLYTSTEHLKAVYSEHKPTKTFIK